MSDLTATSTSSTITLTWTGPDLIPSGGYIAVRRCHRLCEASFDAFRQEHSRSPPVVFSDINPGSYCNITAFIGLFNVTNPVIFDSGIDVITLSVGEFDK